VHSRTRDLIAFVLLVVVLGNSVYGWITGRVDLTLTSTGALTLLGIIFGAKPWSNGKPPRHREDQEEDK